MTRIVFMTQETFAAVAQALQDRRFVNTTLADAGYENLSLDAFGDWVMVPELEGHPAGTVVTHDALLARVSA